MQRRKRSKKHQNEDADADDDNDADTIVSWVDFFCLHKYLACFLFFFCHTTGMVSHAIVLAATGVHACQFCLGCLVSVDRIEAALTSQLSV